MFVLFMNKSWAAWSGSIVPINIQGTNENARFLTPIHIQSLNMEHSYVHGTTDSNPPNSIPSKRIIFRYTRRTGSTPPSNWSVMIYDCKWVGRSFGEGNSQSDKKTIFSKSMPKASKQQQHMQQDLETVQQWWCMDRRTLFICRSQSTRTIHYQTIEGGKNAKDT